MKRIKNILKSDKGITLVELIISSAILLMIITAFLSMVASATKMFATGNRELDIQEEAQIVTNQIEGLLSDANLYAGQVGNEIYAVNEDYVHVVSQRANGVYYTIYNFPSSQDATSENVKALLTNNASALKVSTYKQSSLLSNRLTNLSLDTTDLDDGNVVYLSMGYKNQDREIGVNQSIYLRNKPGLGGGGGGGTPVDNDFDAELRVLRYKTYVTSDLGVDKISPTNSITGADAGKYNVDSAGGRLSLKDSVGINASSAGGAMLNCIKGGQPYKIRLSFDPCSVGIQDSNGKVQTASMRAANVEQANDYISVKGFDTHSTSVYYKISLKVGPNYSFASGGDTLTTGRFTIDNGQLPAQSTLEGDKSFSGGGYYKGVYRLMLDSQSNHLIFRQLSQCDRVETRTPNKPVPVYTITVEHKKSDGSYETLGTTTIKINIPNSSWYH